MGHEPSSRFSVRRDQECLIVSARGPEIELESKDELYALARPGAMEPQQVVLDLTEIVNFKSAILGVLVQFQRQVERAGGRLKVVCPDPDVLLMFRITRIDQILDFHPSEQVAINDFRPIGLSRASAF